MFGGYLDIGERQIAFLIADVLYLIESRDGVANSEASVIGSLRERGNAKALPGNRLTSAASSRRCSAGHGAFQVAFVPLVFSTFGGFIGLLHSVEIDVVSPTGMTLPTQRLSVGQFSERRSARVEFVLEQISALADYAHLKLNVSDLKD